MRRRLVQGRRTIAIVVVCGVAGVLLWRPPVALADDPPPPATHNLVRNPSFEDKDADAKLRPAWWVTVLGSANRHVPGSAWSGSWSVESVLAGEAAAEGCQIANTNWLTEERIQVDLHRPHVFSFWTKSVFQSPTAHNMPVAGFEFFDEQGALLGTWTTERGPMDIADWTKFSFELGPGGEEWPAGTAYVRINLGGAGWEYAAPCEEGRVYAAQAFDDVYLAPLDVALPETGHGSSAGPMRWSDGVLRLVVVGAATAVAVACASRGNPRPRRRSIDLRRDLASCAGPEMGNEPRGSQLVR